MSRKNKPRHLEPSPASVAKPRVNLLAKFMGEAPSAVDEKKASPYASWLVCLLLVLAVFAVFGQATRFDFVNYDDDQYVYANPHVQKGFTAESVVWAFTSFDASNWHPLTWLSHMADCQFYGLNPGKHHLTNVIIHALNAILLFLLVHQLTGRFWPSVFVAFLFAVHPLRAESVAWIAERKDLLSGLFFMLTLMAYVGYARSSFSWLRYLTVIVLFALGLMSKPMLVTTPFVLLLLDYWPLDRAKELSSFKRLLAEKIPLFILVVASCWVTVIAQKKAIEHNDCIPLAIRVENAAISYVNYVFDSFIPLNLAPIYPYPSGRLPLSRIFFVAGVLLTISAIVAIRRKRNPYLAVGWLWYLGMLVPVIGLVQVGSQSMADRYTYLPQIGIWIASVWGALAAAERVKLPQKILVGFAVASVTLLSLFAFAQTSFWQGSETLWKHAIACTKNNYVAYNNYASYLLKSNRAAEAEEFCITSLKIKPNFYEAHLNLGLSYGCQNQFREAIEEYDKALQSDPYFVRALIAKAICENLLDRPQEAVENFKKALSVKPDSFEANYHLGLTLGGTGKPQEAVFYLAQAIQARPEFLDPYLNYISTCDEIGRSADAVPAARKAFELAVAANKIETIRFLQNWLTEHKSSAATKTERHESQE